MLMDSITISTVNDFQGPSPTSAKRKKHSSIACDGCRKLKIRCDGGDPSPSNPHSTSKPCDHCARLGKDCQWAEEDGRKRRRCTVVDPVDRREGQHAAFPREQTASEEDRSSSTASFGVHQVNLDGEKHRNPMADGDVPSTTEAPHINGMTSSGPNFGHKDDTQEASDESSGNERADTAGKEAPYTTLQYSRYLGSTAIAPGYKKISLKVSRDTGTRAEDNCILSDRLSNYSGINHDPNAPNHDGLLPIFDYTTGLPCEEVLPRLLDSFFDYYSDNFCFLNRAYLDQLIKRGEASSFLICTISALSSRFCPPEMFTRYFLPKANGQDRESWEFSLPFLERAKKLLMPLLNIPSCDVVAGLLLLSWADFGDNNEAGTVRALKVQN